MYMSMCGLCHGGCNRYNYLENEPKMTAFSKIRQVHNYNLIFTNVVLDKASHCALDLKWDFELREAFYWHWTWTECTDQWQLGHRSVSWSLGWSGGTSLHCNSLVAPVQQNFDMCLGHVSSTTHIRCCPFCKKTTSQVTEWCLDKKAVTRINFFLNCDPWCPISTALDNYASRVEP